MRQLTLASFSLLMMLAIAGVCGCSKQPSPEQLRADSLLEMARSSVGRGAYSDAKKILFSVRDLDERLGRTAQLAEEEKLLGDVMAAGASFDSAFSFYVSAEERYKSLADRPSSRHVTLAIVALHQRMGQVRKGHEILEEELRLARVFADSEGVAEIQEAMLPSCRALERREEETEILTNLSRVTAGSADRQARTYFESGLCQYYLNLTDPAANDFVQAVSSADNAHDSVLAGRALMRLAMAYEAAGRMNETVRSYGEALKRCDQASGMRELRLELLIRVGTMYLRHKQYSEAARFYRPALMAAQSLGNKLSEGYLFVQLGHCTVDRLPAEAVKQYTLALELFKSVGYSPGYSYALLSLGLAAERANQPAEALQHLKAAVEQTNAFYGEREPDDLYLNCEQAFMGTRPAPALDELIDLLLRLGRNDEAYWYLEQHKSREMFRVLADMDPRTTNGALNTLLGQLFEARGRHVGAERQLARVLNAVGRGGELMADVHGALATSAQSIQQLSTQAARASKIFEPAMRSDGTGLAEIASALPPGGVLVEQVATRRTLYSFVITPGRSGVEVSAIERERLLSLVREYCELLQRREAFADSASSMVRPVESRLQDLTGRLYDLLVRPLEASFAGAVHLFLVPPEELEGIPFHALRRTPGTRGAYLIERMAVSYLPTARLLFADGARPVPVREIVAMGYPGKTDWDVEYELRDIRAFYKDTRLYFNQQASLATLRREQADVLHLAVDFEFNNRIPGNSYVVLSDSASPGIDRRVPVGELFSLPRVPTVIVSNLSPGMTAVHPMQAFIVLANGSGAVVMNSYVPSRKSKKIFGEYFYTALLNGQTGPIAYRTALLGMIRNREFASPGRWGEFFMWGTR